MEPGGINGGSTISGASGILSRAPTSRGFNDLKSEDFFALLIAQLQAQDPLKPADNQALLEQMSMIRQMEQSTTLNKSLGALAGEQRFAATAGLIGHYVGGHVTDSGGNRIAVQGVVIGVIYEPDGSAVLQLHNGRVLPAERVEQVTLLENLPQDVLEQIEHEMAGGAEAAESNATNAAIAPQTSGDAATPGDPAVKDTGASATADPAARAADRQTWLSKLLRGARERQGRTAA